MNLILQISPNLQSAIAAPFLQYGLLGSFFLLLLIAMFFIVKYLVRYVEISLKHLTNEKKELTKENTETDKEIRGLLKSMLKEQMQISLECTQALVMNAKAFERYSDTSQRLIEELIKSSVKK